MAIDQTANQSRSDVERLADIVMSLQRCFVLRLSEQLGRGQVSFPQYFLLGHLSDGIPVTMSEVAERMDHSTAAATGLVDRLENLGYVERTHATNDRRKVLVRITPKGTELVERMRQDIVNNLSQIMEMLEPEERRSWLNIYEKIYQFCHNKEKSCEA